jgi:hypothetical protein
MGLFTPNPSITLIIQSGLASHLQNASLDPFFSLLPHQRSSFIPLVPNFTHLTKCSIDGGLEPGDQVKAMFRNGDDAAAPGQITNADPPRSLV